jgi:hypothetical protein
MFNLMVTNVPGPQMPLYVLGRELRELYPMAMLQPGHALALAVTSYNGQLNFGVLGDYNALPDVHVISHAISAELDTLVELATATAGAPEPQNRHPAPRPRRRTRVGEQAGEQSSPALAESSFSR